MDKFVFLVLLFCSVGFFHDSRAVSTKTRGYVFTAPQRLLAGEIASGCLSFHNVELPANIDLELVGPSLLGDKEELLASEYSVVATGIETCLQLAVPMTNYTGAILRLKIRFSKDLDYVVNSEQYVEIEREALLTFVETDKPIYKPGQHVQFRILMLKHDLKPWKKVIPKVWISNPSEVIVKQWTNVSIENGMAQLTFPLSPEPSSGVWSINVEKTRCWRPVIHTTTFEVEKYVLPRYQIIINSPEYVLADAENVTWNICVKYSYGKPVKGTLLLKLTPRTPSWERKPSLPAIRYEIEFDKPDGCTDFVLSAKILELAHWNTDPNNIVLVAEFTEAGTGIVETTISRTVVAHEALKLDFANYTSRYFKLGLPYHGKLRVLQHDNAPVPNEKIQVCLKLRGMIDWDHNVVECRYFTSSVDGFVDFIVPPQHSQVLQLNFVATAVDYPSKYLSPDKRWKVLMGQPSSHIDVNPWYSPSNSYLTVAQGNQPIVCGEKYSFNVMYTTPPEINETISFHYSINSKGGILIYGHVNHKPSRDTVLNYSEFHNLLTTVTYPNNSTVDGSVVHRFPLSVKVTPSMAPVSELLLYYVRPDGEIVATTYTIEVGPCFENKVKTAWHTDVQTPGSTTQYHVEAVPWSLCGISAVDKSSLFLSKSRSNMINTTGTFDQLRKFHQIEFELDSSIRPFCKEKIDSDDTDQHPQFAARLTQEIEKHDKTFNYVDSRQAFVDFGVIIMSDLKLISRPCPLYFAGGEMSFTSYMEHFDSAVAAAAMDPGIEYVSEVPQKTATLRSFFPETWLWELVPIGKEGKVTIDRTLPDTITDWVGYTTCISPSHGLGIAPPTTITAFQSFFLDYSLPYSVKRGEMMRFKVSLFNYMKHSLPVKIELEEIPGVDLHLSLPTASFCVKPQDNIVHEYILRPRVIGEVNITVSASIDADYPEECGPKTFVFTRDVIVKPILILPEGFAMEETKSIFVCPMNFSEDSTFEWPLTFPEDIVPDSGRAYLNLIGDVLGPAIENLDRLVKLPRGCGEQNMVLLVPNIHVVKYLDAVGNDNSALRAQAITNMEQGYERELNYLHSDGSYSAFKKLRSSLWLTAFVLKSFAQARSLIHIDERNIELTANWIVKKQLSTGCFPVLGTVFHKQMMGGFEEYDESSTALTAYVLISLLESELPLRQSVITDALGCLEQRMTRDNADLYTLILTTYALTLLNDPRANSSMESLMNHATRYNNLVWWEDKSKPSVSLSIEMTSYVILSLLQLKGEENMFEALKAVRWISKQRNAEGGFISTQDTILGLEALTKYAMAVSHRATDLSVVVTAQEVDYVYRLHDDNRMILTQIRLPVLPTTVEIIAEGEGCVLVQCNLKYNVAHTTGSDAFDIAVGVRSAAQGNECSMQEITICARYKMADEESNMALLEVEMISGYVVDQASLNALLEPSSRVKRFEEDQNIVSIYFEKLTGHRTCISFKMIREHVVDHLKPANVKLYDYYQQELTVSTNYKVPAMCSSADPVDEEAKLNFVSDTIARSLLDTNFENHSFLVDSRELNIPDGIEGPVPVYVKPGTYDYKTEMTTEAIIEPFDPVPTAVRGMMRRFFPEEIEEELILQEKPNFDVRNTTINTETNIPSPTEEKQCCPVCMDKIPSDISNIYCSASSAVKVAIRRLRKARLLLDLHVSHEIQRLHGWMEFILTSNCSCSPLDTPGSSALIINKDNDFLATGEHKQTLNSSFHIYGLPMVSGIPCKLAEARASCSNEENIKCTQEDPLVYN